eukprot:GEMP01068199.1.p1 GENE.GEMP01068199.1~~GEMP01068199.1.p1  ORF type:complete len:179 (+),score=55.52 GEMP01068199.1:97-633(+)
MMNVMVLLVSMTVVSAEWANTMVTTNLWQMISKNDESGALENLVFRNPSVLERRSEDGRGALWWAWEYRNIDALALYLAHDLDIHAPDADRYGNSAVSMCGSDYVTLETNAKKRVEDVKARKWAFEDALNEERVHADEDKSDDDVAHVLKEHMKKMNSEDDDDDMFGRRIVPDTTDSD